MDKRLSEMLNGGEGNCLLPFLWMHDGHHEELPQLVRQVYDSGARALCVESRPHEGFAGQSWWDDMDVVLAEAEKLGMKVWILDDKHFPTGFANGMIAEKYPERRMWHLTEDHVDVVGPARDIAILLRDRVRSDDDDDVLLGAYAFRRADEGETLDSEAIDLTAHIHGRYLYWDVPAGVYRIFTLYKTRRGELHKNYIHMIDAESVKVLIEAVYEPHYAHYARYFGNTIAGFFSDEPSFGNKQIGHNTGAVSIYDQRLGQQGLPLPWSEEAYELLCGKLGGEALSRLPALWFPQNGLETEVRVAYMDVITDLWRRHFSMQLGEWCRERGVEYIGHIIEDMNAHARLTYSGGHYFRSLDGQDMAGIDVVLHQIIPGLPHHIHAASLAGNAVDPEFFDYVLARLAASHSHIQPRMKNRAMCEIFGAYGWAEGLPMMKHLMDHMLVRGINRFVPHAFSPKYPDPDCPPHFAAGGLNPQFSAFARLMKYTNQTVHLLGEGEETVSAAILYHAEAEWSGRDYMLMQKPARALYDAQLNYDFLPIDAILEKGAVREGALCVEKMRYPLLIVPYAAWLPETFLEKAAELERQGMKLVFVDGRPEGFEGGMAVPLDELAGYVRSLGAQDISLETPFPLLRFLHVRREGTDVFMLVNESMSEAFEGTVCLPVAGEGVRIDLQLDEVSKVPGGRLPMKLERGQSVLLVYGGAFDGLENTKEYEPCGPLEARWTLSVKPALPGGEYSEPHTIDALCNLTGPKGDPAFSGWMRYETEFEAPAGAAAIDLGVVGECVHAWLNGADLGERYDLPYRFDLSAALRPGRNQLKLEISNNLVHQHMDRFSQFIQINPSGLLGPVTLLRRK